MATKGDRRQAYRWKVDQRHPLIGAWNKQRSHNSFILGEALPSGGSLISKVELLRPGGEVLGYVLYLYSDGQGWVGGVDADGLPKGIEYPFAAFDFDGTKEKILTDGRIQPTGDPTAFYHRSSKSDAMMVKVGHTTVAGYYTRAYLWVTAYECTEEWDGQHWQEVAA